MKRWTGWVVSTKCSFRQTTLRSKETEAHPSYISATPTLEKTLPTIYFVLFFCYWSGGWRKKTTENRSIGEEWRWIKWGIEHVSGRQKRMTTGKEAKDKDKDDEYKGCVTATKCPYRQRTIFTTTTMQETSSSRKLYQLATNTVYFTFLFVIKEVTGWVWLPSALLNHTVLTTRVIYETPSSHKLYHLATNTLFYLSFFLLRNWWTGWVWLPSVLLSHTVLTTRVI